MICASAVATARARPAELFSVVGVDRARTGLTSFDIALKIFVERSGMPEYVLASLPRNSEP
jgi:hypothetical protein